MRIQIVAVVGLLFVAAVPANADPVSYEAGADHVAVWVEGVTTTNHPYGLEVDRSGGVSNVLSWQAPSFDDGRSVDGYRVYRVPDTSFLPVAAFDVSFTSFTDTTADFGGTYVYVVTAFFEDDNGITTESLPSNPAPASPFSPSYPSCFPAWYDLSSPPFVRVNHVCLLP